MAARTVSPCCLTSLHRPGPPPRQPACTTAPVLLPTARCIRSARVWAVTLSQSSATAQRRHSEGRYAGISMTDWQSAQEVPLTIARCKTRQRSGIRSGSRTLPRACRRDARLWKRDHGNERGRDGVSSQSMRGAAVNEQSQQQDTGGAQGHGGGRGGWKHWWWMILCCLPMIALIVLAIIGVVGSR